MTIGKMAAILMIGAAEALAENPAHQIIVSIPDKKLILLEDGKIKMIYPVATGKTSTPTPTGTFYIAARVVNPTWYGPHIVVPPGKGNPLGTRWMGLGFKGYGIHGTNSPRSIGKAASHGCVRMHIADAEQLFKMIAVGDRVDIVGERNELIEALLPVTPAAAAGAESAGGLQ